MLYCSVLYCQCCMLCVVLYGVLYCQCCMWYCSVVLICCIVLTVLCCVALPRCSVAETKFTMLGRLNQCEEDWQRRRPGRCPAGSTSASWTGYAASQNAAKLCGTSWLLSWPWTSRSRFHRPPDADDRCLSKRAFEKRMMRWRRAVRQAGHLY